MGIESPGRKPPQPENLSSLSRDELLARALKAETPEELAEINAALGALKEQGALKTEPAEAPAYKEIGVEKTKNTRIVVKSGEHYVIGKARNAIIAVEPGGKVTIDDATNTQIFKTEGAEVRINQRRDVVIHTGKEAIKGVVDLGGNPKKKREEKPKPAEEAHREEPKQAQIEGEDTIAPAGDDTEPAKAHTEEKKPEAEDLPRADIIELIKDASARGDAEEIRRLTALLRGSPSETKEPGKEKEESGTSRVEEIEEKEAEEILARTEIHGDAFEGAELTPAYLKAEGLEPKYRVRMGETIIWFSSQAYNLGGGRIASVAYVEKAGKTVARTYYRSNSSGVWRYLPNYSMKEGEINWYGKGYDEESITLPFAMQEALARIAGTRESVRTVRNPELVFAGTARSLGEKTYDEARLSDTYYQEVESRPNRVAGKAIYTQNARPEQISVISESTPDFTKKLGGWEQDTVLYGKMEVEIFQSKDGSLKYMFCRDTEGRAWIGGIEDNSETTSTGLKKSWIYGGALTRPAFEYKTQAGEFGNKEKTRGPYVDMFDKFHSNVPIIREYLSIKAVNLEKAKEETPFGAFENAQTFEELFRAIDQKGAIRGTKQTFTPEELKRIISDVREGRLDIYYVTRARGLRLKVYELLEKEKAAQEKDEGFIREPEADAAKKEDEIHGDETPREDAVHEAPREERGARDEPKSAEDRERTKEAEEGGPVSFETRFRDSFGIAPQELRRIPGYADLTEGQKEMVFENLRQMTLGRIQEEAGKAYRVNTAQAKFFGRIWQGASKRYQIAKLEKAHAEEFSYGGMEAHGKILAELVRGAKDGPEALRNEDGSLDIRFVNEKALEDIAGAPLTERAKQSVGEFNASSSLFARIPHEWSLTSASRSERKQYETAKKRYEAARGSLLQEMDRTNGRRRALEDTLALDQKVQMMQFLTTHPKVERELQKIESKHLWGRALANTITEKGVYALFGTVSRTVAVGMLGAIGAPLAAAGMGGLAARGRAKETLREDARLARKGAGKTFEAIKSTGERVRRESRDYVKADVLAKRFESLIYKSHIYGPKGDLATKQLDRLLKYADAKLKSGLINFGAREEGIKNQFELVKELGMARAKLGARNQKSETYARLDAALEGRKEKISTKEKKYVRSQVIKGALLAGGFASAGRAVAEYFYAGNRSPFIPPDEEAEIGREIKKATGAEMRGISAPPETPFATPDEEAEIGRAIKEATGAEMRGVLGFTSEQLTETVKSGDSIWKIAERKLEELYGAKFTELDPARKTYVIDAVKDEIAKNPRVFGLENADKIKIGERIDFSSIFDDREKMASVFGRANDLDDAVRENIVKNNKLIADWVREHPGERLTSERVEDILRAKPGRAEIATDYGHDSGPLRDENYYHGVSLAEADAYGSREGAFFGKLAGLSDIEYRVIRAQTVGKILAEIPSRAEAEAIYQGGIPGRTIDLPYLEQYDRQEFEGHIRLAELIRHYIEQNPHKEYFMDMEVDDFFKAAAPEEGPVFRGAAEPGFLEPEEFAQNPQPIEHSTGKFAEAPYAAEYAPPVERAAGKFAEAPYNVEYTPADEFVGTTKIAGEDIKKFGSAAEAFIAKERLGMVAQEWNKIKSILVGELLKETPDGGHAMDEETLSRWYESKRPALPEEYRFLSFKRYALLADAFRTMLVNHSERVYLEELPVAELAKIFVLQATK